MSLTDLLNLACTITSRAPSEDRDAYGNPVSSTTTVTTVCELQQQSRDEQPDEISSTKWLLILPADTAIATDDTVVVASVAYEVDGEPWVVRSPWTGTVSHVEAALRRAEGVDDIAQVDDTEGLVLELVTENV